MSTHNELPRYDWQRTYEWNYEHAPEAVQIEVPGAAGQWQFCGRAVDSPLGIPAGPLLNGQWCLYYASLGFDVLTYKTVRSRSRACYDLPNLLPVRCDRLRGGERNLVASESMDGSWAVSFGMPSKDPEVWRADVEATRDRLPAGKLLCVSVVGTIEEGWSIEDLARDYALCARWAVDSGADAVESNFSCPNVATCDGQLYQNAASAATVAQCVHDAVAGTPCLIKVGHITRRESAEALLDAVDGFADALAMTNSVASTVRDSHGVPVFNGELRGICGEAIRAASVDQVALFAELIRQRRSQLQIVGVGGVRSADHVRQYLAAGAHAVHAATSAMLCPTLAIEIKRQLAAATDAADLDSGEPTQRL